MELIILLTIVILGKIGLYLLRDVTNPSEAGSRTAATFSVMVMVIVGTGGLAGCLLGSVLEYALGISYTASCAPFVMRAGLGLMSFITFGYFRRLWNA